MTLDMRFCANCKHLIGVRHDKVAHPFWNCGRPENIIGAEKNPVTGEEKKIFKYSPCLQVRQIPDACGAAGNWWELYSTERYIPENPRNSKELDKTSEQLLNELGI